MTTGPGETSGRTIVICLDGTSNEPESGQTNVARIYELAAKNERQLAFYHPGVGTMGARGAVTPLAKRATVLLGLVMGYGVRDNIAEAYQFLMRTYQAGDRVMVFGFSRGAYTARALTGMLRTVGLLRPGAENLIPYALKLYAKSGGKHPSAEEEKAFWKSRADFTRAFGNPDFPNPFDTSRHQVHFLGVFDTVKSIGWFNWKARFEQAHWPFTRRITNVGLARHALAIDERRRPYPAYRFDDEAVRDSAGRYQQRWFAGVHSDVGGQYVDDHRLSDLVLEWMAGEAVAAGLEVDPTAYKRLLGVKPGQPLPADHTLGRIHTNGGPWRLLGWKGREIAATDDIDPSVRYRIDATAGDAHPYRPRLPSRS